MENYYIDKIEIGILKGKLLDPIRGDKSYQTMATDVINPLLHAIAVPSARTATGLWFTVTGFIPGSPFRHAL